MPPYSKAIGAPNSKVPLSRANPLPKANGMN
jgi:hypothetical protein